ncbi:MAG: glycosyltransferase family 2 protein [Acidobacteriaceae bacterium]
MSQPLLSVVIACHNHEGFIREAVESALSQEFPGKEVIVVDDGSRDRTPEVLSTFGASITFARFPVNRGAGAARNHGASLARGKYLVFLDGDDALLPQTLEVYGQLVTARNPTILLGRSVQCYGKLPEQPPQLSREVQFVEYADFFAKDRPWVYNTSSLVVERAPFLASGGWSEDIFYQDIQDLLNKMGIAGRTLLVLSPDTVWYRMHTTNAVRRVQPFIDGIYTLLRKAKDGAYPGGQEQKLRRSIWFGGLIFYWMKEAFSTGFYRDGFALLAAKWWLIFLAAINRGVIRITGRKPVETLALKETPVPQNS